MLARRAASMAHAAATAARGAAATQRPAWVWPLPRRCSCSSSSSSSSSRRSSRRGRAPPVAPSRGFAGGKLAGGGRPPPTTAAQGGAARRLREDLAAQRENSARMFGYLAAVVLGMTGLTYASGARPGAMQARAGGEEECVRGRVGRQKRRKRDGRGGKGESSLAACWRALRRGLDALAAWRILQGLGLGSMAIPICSGVECIAPDGAAALREAPGSAMNVETTPHRTAGHSLSSSAAGAVCAAAERPFSRAMSVVQPLC